MSVEDTDLERRVLAHERVLQALIGHIAEADPELLERLAAAFGQSSPAGQEHDYTDTASYAEQFIRRIVDRGDPPVPAKIVSAPATARVDSVRERPAMPTRVCITRRSGIWEVTKDGAFLGHYTTEEPARVAAAATAASVIAAGGSAEVADAPVRQ